MLSITAEYALRSLVHLARLDEGETFPGKRLAADARVPSNYLSKILWVLGNAGIVSATRGSGGGYRLQKDPKTIFLIDVVELFDGIQGRPECLLGEKGICSDQEPCTAHETWNRVRKQYLEFLETTSLTQISEFPGKDSRDIPPRESAEDGGDIGS